MAKYDKEYEELMAQMRAEFVDEAEENFNEIDIMIQNLRAGNDDPKSAIIKLRRIAHSMKGTSGLSDFPLVGAIMHRLEDYLSGLDRLENKYLDDVQVYIDKARKFSSLSIDHSSIPASDIVRQLPDRILAGIDTTGMVADTENVIEVMMVIKEKTAGMLFERELRAAGLRVITVKNSFQAIESAVREKPNMIVVSGVLDELTGVDVAAAIASMPTTSKIPVCMLTSFPKGHPDLSGLPDKVELIHKNKLKDDLLNVLEKFKLIS